ncbi:unnamed protein product [Durusdinium trenchii]|uniref:5-hmdU DNA kinase helical domain-containing protein n=2 Tax=Durusdinium trenchii TaxID=1381693 RepID=A0ABP0LFX5_9DINO
MKRPSECEHATPKLVDTQQAGRDALQLEDVKSFYTLLNHREAIRKGRLEGLHGRHLYDTLTEDAGGFAEYLRRYKSTNVHRWHDATTKGLHAFCAAEKRRVLCCKSKRDEEQLKQQLVLNFAVWRFIGGTVAFAGEVGFLRDWGDREKDLIRKVIQRGFEDKRLPTLLSNAYSWPRKMREALTRGHVDADTLTMVLRNEGKKMLKGTAVYDVTLVGKFNTLDQLWKVSKQVVEAAKCNQDGRSSMERVAAVLLDVPYFGNGQGVQRRPSFFAKELIQDLLDTPVFQGGRTQVEDHFTFCPVGPGSIKGLQLVFRRTEIQPSETLPMMQALWSYAGDYFHGDPDALELHDIQFQLCEYQKKFNTCSHRLYSAVSDDDPGGPMLHWTRDFILQRLQEMLYLTEKLLTDFETDPTPVRSLAKELCTWLGLSFRPSGSTALIHGDLVVLQDVKSEEYYSTTANGMLIKVCNPSDAARFRVTIDEKRLGPLGRISFGDAIFLETGRCKQLSWWTRKGCFAARVDKRFALSNRLTLEPMKPSEQWDEPYVQLNEPVNLKMFVESTGQGQQEIPKEPIRLSRPMEVSEREEHIMNIAQSLWSELRKRRRTRK